MPERRAAPYLIGMSYVVWTLRLLVAVLVVSFLHYTLPDREIVRIVNTYEERQDFGGLNSIFWTAGSAGAGTNPDSRDVLFIQTIKPNGDTFVLRNEDTGWGWPPYFKFDSADLQTEAADATSTRENPRWFAVRHYGWRNTLLSSFPNATSMREVESPDVRLIPWFNIIFLTLLFVLCATIWRLWRNFRQARIDPVIDEIEDDVDAARSRVGGFFSRLFGRK